MDGRRSRLRSCVSVLRLLVPLDDGAVLLLLLVREDGWSLLLLLLDRDRVVSVLDGMLRCAGLSGSCERKEEVALVF